FPTLLKDSIARPSGEKRGARMPHKRRSRNQDTFVIISDCPRLMFSTHPGVIISGPESGGPVSKAFHKLTFDNWRVHLQWRQRVGSSLLWPGAPCRRKLLIFIGFANIIAARRHDERFRAKDSTQVSRRRVSIAHLAFVFVSLHYR
ncbi:MAG TPA: hypothetical protein VF783_07985, partial [Terriglobales bacterium]